MAIETYSDWRTQTWTKPELSLIEGGVQCVDCGSGKEFFYDRELEVAPIRRPSARVIRRRRALVGLLILGVLVLLYLPVNILGGSSPAPAQGSHTKSVALTSSGTPVPSMTYVVQPGETLWELAQSIEPFGDPRQLARQIANQLGTTNLYPGERIQIL